MRRLALALTLAGVLAAPAQATAVPYLTYGEAARQIGASLHSQFDYRVIGGSLDSICERYRRNRVACDFSFWDADYDSWCGYGQVLETRRSYYTRLRGIHLC